MPQAVLGLPDHAVIPYYGYGRQDRKDSSRADLRQAGSGLNHTTGADRVLTMDLHAGRFRVL